MIDFEHGFVQEMEKKQEQQEKEKANAEEMRRMASENSGKRGNEKSLILQAEKESLLSLWNT